MRALFTMALPDGPPGHSRDDGYNCREHRRVKQPVDKRKCVVLMNGGRRVLTTAIAFRNHVAAKIQPMNFLKSVGHRHSLKGFTINHSGTENGLMHNA
jgi:hypothetical protein